MWILVKGFISPVLVGPHRHGRSRVPQERRVLDVHQGVVLAQGLRAGGVPQAQQLAAEAVGGGGGAGARAPAPAADQGDQRDGHGAQEHRAQGGEHQRHARRGQAEGRGAVVRHARRRNRPFPQLSWN